MNTRRLRLLLLVLAVAVGVALVPPMAAQTAELRVLASNGVKTVMEAVQLQGERAVGRKLVVHFDSSAALKAMIDRGEPFDVAVATSDLLDTLIKEGKVPSASTVRLARAGIGVGIRAGAKKPDISNADALKRSLVAAKAITYAQDGASRPHIDKMVESLGIAAAMKSKTVLEQGSTRSAARVAQGDADMIITLMSEIMPAPGVELVGPLPAAFQNYVSFSAGVGAKVSDAAAAAKLVGFLAGPSLAPTFKAKGLEPVAPQP
jgi:molybdate transport system substrate-binding protein